MGDFFTFVFFILIAVIAALSFESPLFLFGLFGERATLIEWWRDVGASGDIAKIIIFAASYLLLGFLLWAGPAWYMVKILQPGGGALLRQRTEAFLSFICVPFLPLWDFFITSVGGPYTRTWERLVVQALYRERFQNQFSTFEAFMEWFARGERGSADAEQAPPSAGSKGFDALKDAELLLGLQASYTSQDLKTRFRELIRTFHTDHAPPNDIGRRIIAARDTILIAKRWKK